MAAAFTHPSHDLDEHFRQLNVHDDRAFEAAQERSNKQNNTSANEEQPVNSPLPSSFMQFQQSQNDLAYWTRLYNNPADQSKNLGLTAEQLRHIRSDQDRQRQQIQERSSAADLFSLHNTPNAFKNAQFDRPPYSLKSLGDADSALTMANLYAQNKSGDWTCQPPPPSDRRTSNVATASAYLAHHQVHTHHVGLFNPVESRQTTQRHEANAARGPGVSTSLLYGGAKPYTPVNVVSGATNTTLTLTAGRNNSRSSASGTTRRMGSNLSNWGMAGGPTPGLDELHRQYNAQQRAAQQAAATAAASASAAEEASTHLPTSSPIRFASTQSHEHKFASVGSPHDKVAAGGGQQLPASASGNLPSAYELASLGVGIGPGVNPSLGSHETSGSERPPIINTGNAGPMCVQPGDWVCSSCGFVNWRRRRICMRCYPFAENSEVSASLADGAMLAAQIAAGHNPGQETIAALARPSNRRERNRNHVSDGQAGTSPPGEQQQQQQQQQASGPFSHSVNPFDRVATEDHMRSPHVSGVDSHDVCSSYRYYGPIDMPVSPFSNFVSVLPLGDGSRAPAPTPFQQQPGTYADEGAMRSSSGRERQDSGSSTNRQSGPASLLFSSNPSMSPPSSGTGTEASRTGTGTDAQASSSPWSLSSRSFSFDLNTNATSSSPPSSVSLSRGSGGAGTSIATGLTRDIWAKTSASTPNHIPWHHHQHQPEHQPTSTTISAASSRRTLSASSNPIPMSAHGELLLSPRKSHAIPIRRPAPIGTRPSTGTGTGGATSSSSSSSLSSFKSITDSCKATPTTGLQPLTPALNPTVLLPQPGGNLKSPAGSAKPLLPLELPLPPERLAKDFSAASSSSSARSDAWSNSSVSTVRQEGPRSPEARAGTIGREPEKSS